MKYAIFSDIHANLEAFEAVLHRVKEADKVICLGDIVGYGPNPNECVELIKEKEVICIAGNHDKAAVGELNPKNFNRDAKDAILWTKINLTKENAEFLKNMPITVDIPEFQIVHGSLDDPLEKYIMSMADAEKTFAAMAKPLCFVGHSHKPMFIGQTEDGSIESKVIQEQVPIDLSPYKKVIMNVGSVGQPRDRNPNACYVIYNHQDKTVTLHRAHYEIKEVQKKMREAELPDHLINRLTYGL